MNSIFHERRPHDPDDLLQKNDPVTKWSCEQFGHMSSIGTCDIDQLTTLFGKCDLDSQSQSKAQIVKWYVAWSRLLKKRRQGINVQKDYEKYHYLFQSHVEAMGRKNLEKILIEEDLITLGVDCEQCPNCWVPTKKSHILIGE